MPRRKIEGCKHKGSNCDFPCCLLTTTKGQLAPESPTSHRLWHGRGTTRQRRLPMTYTTNNSRGRDELEASPAPSCSSSSASSDYEGASPKRSFDQSGLCDVRTTTRKPMRKRAKTQEEKEARAQERVMRNRAAAQVSRERKREYVVTLEAENKVLTERVSSLSSQNTTLQDSVNSLTQRLESLERMLSYFSPPGAFPAISRSIADQGTEPNSPSQTFPSFDLPTPPGTIRPSDMQSVIPSPLPGKTIDFRNPAVIASGPQRRSMVFPWNLSSQSPLFRQMESMISFWTTILCATTLQAFAIQMISFQLLNFQRLSLCKAVNYRRSSATLSWPGTKPLSEYECGTLGAVDHLVSTLAAEAKRRSKGIQDAPWS